MDRLYFGATGGAGSQSKDASETVRFDTNLDGVFTDIVRTVAGADAFSPGFCGGLAVGPTAAAGCTDDEEGIDFGGRVGYDWQIGRLIVDGLVDVSRTAVIDSVTAFSTTPAFYSFIREVKYVAGLRGRAGFGNDGVLVYGTGGGIEFKIGSRWSLTGDYLVTSLDNRDESAFRAQGPAPATNPFILVTALGTDLQRTEQFEFQAVRVGLSYRF